MINYESMEVRRCLKLLRIKLGPCDLMRCPFFSLKKDLDRSGDIDPRIKEF